MMERIPATFCLPKAPRRSSNRTMYMRHFAFCSLLLGSLALAPMAGQGAEASEKAPDNKPGHWQSLFDGKTLKGWHSWKKTTAPDKGWVVEDGWLHCLGEKGGDLISEGQYEQFELE